MHLPDLVNAGWIATLANDQLLTAEAKLHGEFRKEELAEKKRAGARYEMMRGPESLIAAWHRWLMVNNEALARHLVVKRVVS